MKAIFLLCSAVLGLTFAALPTCRAGESLFSRAYTTETVPQGHYELEQVVRNRTGRAFGDYSAYDFKSEFEYGLQDNFQVAAYLNSGYLHARGAPDDNDPSGNTGFDQDKLFVQSFALEFIYRVLSPVSDPIGLAFYVEPEWLFYDEHNGDKTYDSMENEFRILVQKNLYEDQLILVYNLVLNFEYFRYDNQDTKWMGELDWNNEFGATYRLASNWYGGLEIRNHNEEGNYWTHDHSVFFAGPVLHYGGAKLWASLGELAQVYGNPSGPDTNPDNEGSFRGPPGLFLHSHERYETTLKVGFPF